MSGIFKGQMGNGELVKGASYKQGALCYDPGLVNRLVQRCEYLDTNTREEIGSFVKGAVPAQMESIEHFDHNAFLEAIIAACAVDSNIDDLNLRLDFLISVSMQALYDAGIQEFHIDFTRLPKHKDYFVVCKVRGNDKSPLKLTTTGDVLRLGSAMEYCELEVAEGSVQSVGMHAVSSVFRLSGPKTEVESVAMWATDSEYHVKELKPVLGSLANMPLGIEPSYASVLLSTSKNCRFYVTEGVSKEVLQQLKAAEFFSKGNKILIPDCPGKWKEVFPE